MRHFWMLFPLLFAFLSTEGEGGGGGGAPDAPLVPAEEAPETQSTAERALDMFNAPEEPAPVVPEEPKPGDPAAPVEPKPGEPAVPAKPAEPAAPVVPAGYDPTKIVEKVEDFEKALPFFKDATFQKVLGDNKSMAQSVQQLREIFDGGWREGGQKYTIGSNDDLKGILEDAFSVYDIGNLHMPVAAFMDVFSKNFPEGNVKAVLAGLVKYAATKGVTAETAEQLDNPAMIESYKTRQALAQSEQRNRQEQAGRELAEAKGKLNTHFNEFFAALKVEPGDEVDYLDVMNAKVATDPALAKEIREGRYGNLDRILTEYHNRQVDRDKKRLEQRTKDLNTRQEQIDKAKGLTPTGGGGAAPPTEVKKAKINVADPEERRKQALKEFTA